MKNRHFYFYLLFLSTLLASCSSTKYVSDGEYLLNKVNIKVENKKVANEQLTDYIGQMPNKNVLFFPKLGLHIYSLSGRDTTKWINRVLRKIGSAPVIHDDNSARNTQKQLTKRMQNLGYLRAETHYCTDTIGKKINITYCVRPNDLYTLKNFTTEIESTEMRYLLKTRNAKKILSVKSDIPFESETFDNISAQLTNALQDMGYYYLSKENFYFLADTAVGNHQVDVTLKYRSLQKDTSLADPALRRVKIRNVTILNGVEKDGTTDTTHIAFKDMKIINDDEKFIRPTILYLSNFIRSGRYYSNKLIDNTYASFNSLGAVGQVGMQLKAVADDSLDAEISLHRSNLYHFQFGVDGTNTAGDLGVASYVAFQQKNLFHGSEILSIKLNGAFEHINGNSQYEMKADNYYEYGGEISLSIPKIILDFLPQRYLQQVGASTTFSFGANWRKRPEYNRRFLSLDWKFNWYTDHKKWFHTFDVYNINLVVTPWTSKWFQEYLDRKGNEMLKESYRNLFITRSSYSFVFSSTPSSEMENKSGWSMRSSLDIAGTLPYLVCTIFPVKKSDGVYGILGTPFAQYMRFNFDISRIIKLREHCQMVLHGGLGVALPYGNSDVMPYEQRFFAGGANSVRGWNTRTLGPGSYASHEKGNFITQTGDIRLALNLEYRFQTNTFLDLATFLDAGNVWTIKAYDNQENGQFRWNQFYKELGFSWGVGIRPNFKFIVLRLDAGMKIYDPSYTMADRWVITHPKFPDSFALHFAVGYPF